MNEDKQLLGPLSQRILSGEPLAPVSGSADELLRAGFPNLPDWIKEAYHKDLSIQLTMREYAQRKESVEAMLWKLVEYLYAAKVLWQDRAESIESQSPPLVYHLPGGSDAIPTMVVNPPNAPAEPVGLAMICGGRFTSHELVRINDRFWKCGDCGEVVEFKTPNS